MRRVWLITSILILLFTSGCGIIGKTTAEAATLTGDVSTLGIEPDFSYARTPQRPNIYLDSEGYVPGAKKVLFIEGGDIEKEYSIVHADTGSVEYVGTLTATDIEGSENRLYIGDFSDYVEPGSYRVYQNNVGYSDEFRIDSKTYRNIYSSTYYGLEKYTYESNSDLIYSLANMLLTHEIYAGAKVDEDYIREQIEYLVSQQDVKTGGVYQYATDSEAIADLEIEAKAKGQVFERSSLISLTTTAQYAGLLAQYCYSYYDKDPTYGAYLLGAANRAYLYMDQYRDNADVMSWHYAACQLLRATGYSKYKVAIDNFDALTELPKADPKHNYEILADVAYLKTPFKTDYARCERLMAKYVDTAEYISGSTSKASYYVQSDIDTLTEDEVLNNMMALGLVSYVLSGQEYASIEYNYIHYLFGGNSDHLDHLVSAHTDDTAILSDYTKMSKLLFILGCDSEVNSMMLQTVDDGIDEAKNNVRDVTTD